MRYRFNPLSIGMVWLGTSLLASQAMAGMCAMYSTAYGGTYKITDYNAIVPDAMLPESRPSSFATYDSKKMGGGYYAMLSLSTPLGKRLNHDIILDDGSTLSLTETEESCLTPGYAIGTAFLGTHIEIPKARILKITYKNKTKKKCIKGQVGSFGIEVIIYPTDPKKRPIKILKKPFKISRLKPGKGECPILDPEKIGEALETAREKIEEKAKQGWKDLKEWNKGEWVPDWVP